MYINKRKHLIYYLIYIFTVKKLSSYSSVRLGKFHYWWRYQIYFLSRKIKIFLNAKSWNCLKYGRRWSNKMANIFSNKVFVTHEITQDFCQTMPTNNTKRQELRTGHYKLTHEYLLKETEPPLCNQCNRITSTHHLFECSKYHAQRQNYKIISP